MTIGDRILKTRLSRGIAQTDLAELCGISKQLLYKYENGIVDNIPLSRVEKIAEILHVPPAYLMGWEDIPYLQTCTSKAPLTPIERQLLTTVRKMTSPGQQAVLDYAEFCAAKPEYQRPVETMAFAARAKGGLTGEKSLTPEGEAAWNEMQEEGSDPTP